MFVDPISEMGHVYTYLLFDLENAVGCGDGLENSSRIVHSLVLVLEVIMENNILEILPLLQEL